MFEKLEPANARLYLLEKLILIKLPVSALLFGFTQEAMHFSGLHRGHMRTHAPASRALVSDCSTDQQLAAGTHQGFLNHLCKCFMRKEVHSICLLDLKHTHNAFWCKYVNKTFVCVQENSTVHL